MRSAGDIPDEDMVVIEEAAAVRDTGSGPQAETGDADALRRAEAGDAGPAAQPTGTERRWSEIQAMFVNDPARLGPAGGRACGSTPRSRNSSARSASGRRPWPRPGRTATRAPRSSGARCGTTAPSGALSGTCPRPAWAARRQGHRRRDRPGQRGSGRTGPRARPGRSERRVRCPARAGTPGPTAGPADRVTAASARRAPATVRRPGPAGRAASPSRHRVPRREITWVQGPGGAARSPRKATERRRPKSRRRKTCGSRTKTGTGPRERADTRKPSRRRRP